MTNDETHYSRWIAEQLARVDERAVAIEQERSGPLGAVYTVQTAARRWYFKTCAPVYAYEPGLTAALASWFPDDLPTVLGADTGRGWLLVSDVGPTVRQLTHADGDLTRWEEMLRRWAALQQKTAPRVDDLLALGAPDRRLERLPGLYAELIADTGSLLIGAEDGVSEADLERLRAFRPAVESLCRRLADYKLPQTLNNDDFHANNVALLDGRYRFFDWGEACIAHPFYALMMALRYARFIFHADDSTLERLRRVYLDCWLDYEPIERLVEAARLGGQLGCLCRALTWWQVTAGAGGAYRAENAGAVSGWLLTFLDNTPFE